MSIAGCQESIFILENPFIAEVRLADRDHPFEVQPPCDMVHEPLRRCLLLYMTVDNRPCIAVRCIYCHHAPVTVTLIMLCRRTFRSVTFFRCLLLYTIVDSWPCAV